MPDVTFLPAITLSAVAEGKAVKVTLGRREVLICNSQGRLFAIENKCSHADQALECGHIRNGWISCPAHGARFDLESGEAIASPATEPIATFPLRIEHGVIEVAVD